MIVRLAARVRPACTRPNPSEAFVLDALRALERAVLGFRHTLYDHESLHGALQEYLDMEIRIELLRDDEYALAGRSVRLGPVQAGLMYVEGAEHVTIFLPASTPEADWQDLVFHELWHLAAGHPLPFRHRGARGRPAFWRPYRVLCPRVPPYDLGACAADPELLFRCLGWCEADAEAAVVHLKTISALGRTIYDSEEPLYRHNRTNALKHNLHDLQRLLEKFSGLLSPGTNLAPSFHTTKAAVHDAARRLRLTPVGELRAQRGVEAVALLWSADLALHEEA